MKQRKNKRWQNKPNLSKFTKSERASERARERERGKEGGTGRQTDRQKDRQRTIVNTKVLILSLLCYVYNLTLDRTSVHFTNSHRPLSNILSGIVTNTGRVLLGYTGTRTM